MYIRKRGKNYYISGKIRVGKDTVEVKEHSTGFTKLAEAREYASKLESEIRESILNPTADKTSKTTFDECLINYLNKKHPKLKEMNKLEVINKYFSGVRVSDIKDKWNDFCKRDVSIGTLNRYASVLNAILSMASEDLGINPPKIKKQPVKDTKVFLLTDDTREKLLSCYSDHDRPIFILLAYQGFREQECLQLLWEDINLKERTIIIRTSKNGETRQVPMHRKTWWALARHWIKEKKPTQGNVWLNTHRKPYTDTRVKIGSSPLYRNHLTALRKLKSKYGIELKSRVHDWRHDWAGRMVMAGVDLLTVQKLGGWKSLSMVNRYATFSKEHEIQAINKI